LKATLERLVDFDRINSRETRVSVGAVNVETGNFEYFDNANRKLVPEHFMASGALPPGFPAVEIEGTALLGRRPGFQHAAHGGLFPARRGATRSLSRSICGRQKASCRKTCSMSMSAGRTSPIPAARAW
jgi:hypothetical protein